MAVKSVHTYYVSTDKGATAGTLGILIIYGQTDGRIPYDKYPG